VPLIAFAAGDILAALHIPSLPTFREKVDRRWRANVRQASREQLMTEIEKRAGKRALSPARPCAPIKACYERVQSLYQRADSGHGRLAWR
jgi:hypothetical protein